MNILEAMNKLTTEQWSAISEIIQFHGDPSVLEWILKETKNNKSWNIEYDFFNHDDAKWYLLSNDRSFVLATADKILPLRELATQYGKAVDIDDSNHPNSGREVFY